VRFHSIQKKLNTFSLKEMTSKLKSKEHFQKLRMSFIVRYRLSMRELAGWNGEKPSPADARTTSEERACFEEEMDEVFIKTYVAEMMAFSLKVGEDHSRSDHDFTQRRADREYVGYIGDFTQSHFWLVIEYIPRYDGRWHEWNRNHAIDRINVLYQSEQAKERAQIMELRRILQEERTAELAAQTREANLELAEQVARALAKEEAEKKDRHELIVARDEAVRRMKKEAEARQTEKKALQLV
jgi:hypothetical protein